MPLASGRGDLLGVAQIGVRFVLHHDRSPVDGGREQAVQRVSFCPSLVDLFPVSR